MSYATREESIFEGQPFELYKFTMASQNWYLASGEADRTHGGQTYTATPIRRTGLAQGGEEKDSGVNITLPRDHAVAQLFVSSMPAAPLSLTIYRGHEGELEAATIVQFVGRVVSASFGEDGELHGAREEVLLRNRIPRMRYQTPCNKIIYSAACGVLRTNFDEAATVTAVAGAVVTSTTFGGHANGWWTNGYIEFGLERRMVIRHVGNDVTLIVPLAGLAVNDVVTAYPGCARTYVAACIGKFSNGPQFFGFEWIPKRNPFKGIEWS